MLAGSVEAFDYPFGTASIGDTGEVSVGLEEGPAYFKIGELFRDYNHESMFVSGRLTVGHEIEPTVQIAGIVGAEIYLTESVEFYQNALGDHRIINFHPHFHHNTFIFVNNTYLTSAENFVSKNLYFSFGLHKQWGDREYFWFGGTIGEAGVYYGGLDIEAKGRIHPNLGIQVTLRAYALDWRDRFVQPSIGLVCFLDQFDFAVVYTATFYPEGTSDGLRLEVRYYLP